MNRAAYPFSALVGADDLKLALLLDAVSPAIGGVLVRGEKGTAKSTAVRGLAALLPAIEVVPDCRFSCAPSAPDPLCPDGPHEHPEPVVRDARLVELPVGASEDRLAGSLDLERALTQGRRAFEPGLLAAAHRGVLYVDEVNLLGDHLVDLLLDAAAMGINHVEREGVSVRHAARFQLVGTMNPEEGELRPQLLDRFGLTVEIKASRDVDERAEVVRRRLAYEAEPVTFTARWTDADAAIASRISAARKLLPEVVLGDHALRAVVAACTAFEVDGMRADIVTAKTATALAAWDGRTDVTVDDVRAAALLALPHRRRRGPFEQPGIDEDRLDEALDALDEPEPDPPPERPHADPPPDASTPPDGAPPPPDQGAPPPEPTQTSPDDMPGASEHEPGHAADSASDSTPPAAGSGEPTTLPVGATFDPVLLQVPGTGAGAWGRRSPALGDRGRHAADRLPAGRVTDLALAATLRAAAPNQVARTASQPRSAGLIVHAADLREKVREGREGNLVLFVVDASGSMAARKRMTAVKGAVVSLLTDAYQRRDRIGMVVFRGDSAQVVLPPTSSVELAVQRLADLPTGGRTPLAAGLERAAGVVAAEAVRDPRRRPLLVLLTDGRATGSTGVADAERAAAGLAGRGVAAVVVDTEDAVVRLRLAGRIAGALGAPWLRLEDLAAGALAGVVRGLQVGRAA